MEEEYVSKSTFFTVNPIARPCKSMNDERTVKRTARRRLDSGKKDKCHGKESGEMLLRRFLRMIRQ